MENKQKNSIFLNTDKSCHSPQTAHFTGICNVIRHRRMQNIPKIWKIGG